MMCYTGPMPDTPPRLSRPHDLPAEASSQAWELNHPEADHPVIIRWNANCSRCGETKPEDQFYKRSDGGPRSYCIPCYAVSNAESYERNRDARVQYDRERGSGWDRNPENRERYATTSDQAHDKYLQRTYNITLEDFNALWLAQGESCAICDGKHADSAMNRRPTVDHDHKTQKVRGLLCFTCNTSIGKLGDDYESLQRAADYLRGNS